MGAFAGPKIVEDGLVFALDGANYKSFKGSSALNLLYNISNTYSTTDTSTFKVSYGDVIENIPELGYKSVRYCNIYNDYNGGSGQCCPNLLRYGGNVLGQNITVSPSTTYTYQIIYKVKSGYTNGNYMYRYEYNGGTYVTEGGVHNTNNRTSLGNDWWFAWGQFTTQSTTNNLWLTGMWYYQYGVYDTIYVAGVSLHQGTNIIPAKFMLTPQENRGTTVATGGGWADLTGNGNHGALVNGVRESSDNLGALVFDGSNDYGDAGSITPNIGDFTVGFIYQLTGTGGRGGLFERKAGIPYNGFSLGQGGGNNWSGTVSGTSDFNNRISVNFTYPLLNTWYYDVIVYSSGNTLTNYRNGIFVSFNTGVSQGNLSTQGTRTNFLIANRDNITALPIKIASIQAYNKALTASEIQQNFNATRSRFDI